MPVVFFGSPDFALPSLKALINSGEFVAAVVTQPDKPRGRGRKLKPSTIKQCAIDNGIKVLTPMGMDDEAFLAEIEGLKPEFLVVVAFGRILSKRILGIPARGAINVHASLLPKYRGASPVAWSILKGDRETGVTTMMMDEGLDTGDILLQEPVPIEDEDTAGSMSIKLSEAGGGLLVKTLDGIRMGTVKPQSQGNTPTEYARLLSKEDGHIDWSKGTMEIHNMVRALSPWPSAYSFLRGQRLKLTGTSPGGPAPKDAGEGTVTETGADHFGVKTADGTLRVLRLQPGGKREMSAGDFLLGRELKKGAQLD
jgi:methionyl-tRNA formyltransferase